MQTVARNYFTGNEYQGRNVQALPAGQYATFLQWQANGYRVRKGEKGRQILKVVETKKETRDGKEKKGRGVRFYYVFSIDQVEKQ